MTWEIIDYGPQIWQLYQDEAQNLFLCVRCQSGFMEFDTLLQLSPEEGLEWKALGRVAVDYLGNKVSYWPNRYQERNVAVQFESEHRQAVRDWLDAHPGQFL
ncbi:MAG TPA: hypothetical protein VF627_11625 [Abditibacterium sp.]|jgi:hypothetical protein